MILHTGNCPSDPAVVDKRPYYTVTHTIDVQYKGAVSDHNFDMVFSDGIVSDSDNYADLDGLYYYIKDRITLPGGRVQIRFELDPLTSYADQIKALSCTIVRQEYHRDSMLMDRSYTMQSNRQLQNIPFNRTPFAANYATDRVYLLTVLGGVDNTGGAL